MLDGIRGALALWVFGGHLALTLGAKIPILTSANFAVDLFMVMSGFLMCYHWSDENATPEKFQQRTRNFYIRRFFRIAPVYYLALIFALLFQHQLYGYREELFDLFNPGLLNAAVHRDSYLNIDIWNVLTHVTFTFGFFPQLVSNNTLPDWSIGLEMQFYLFFPLIMLAFARFSVFRLAIFSLVIGMLSRRLLGKYDIAGLLAAFPKPGMLSYKLGYFLAGIFLAECYKCGKFSAKSMMLITGIFLCTFDADIIVRMALILIVLCLFSSTGELYWIKSVLAGKVGVFFGNISYTVYLCHLFFVDSVCHLLIQSDFFLKLSPIPRFVLAGSLLFPVVVAVGFALHWGIERPGIRLGKKFLK